MTERSEPARATTLEEMRAMQMKLITLGGVGRGLAFVPRPSDVVIAPFGKCGTTWLQQIVHGLRTGGDMDFDDISRVVPWIETAHDLGLDLEAEQKAEPRAFKSHLPYTAVPKGCRYLVSLRDPRDALVSFYRFVEGWFFEPGSISIAEFAREVCFDRSQGRDYWTHFASWWPQRDEPTVLLLAFENMKQDLPGTVRRVASSLDLAADDALIDLVVRQSSFDFMLEHKNRFDDLLMRELSERACNLPPGSDSAKVRRGEVGTHRAELTPDLVAELDDIWRQTIAAELGLPSYQAVVEALR